MRFYGRQQTYKIYSPIYTANEYNEDQKTWKAQADQNVYIIAQDRTMTNMNDLSFMKATYVGYAQPNTAIQQGWLVGTYEVKSKIGNVLYLTEFEDGIQ